MRLFAALVPPAEVLADLADFLEPRREAGADLRWSDSEQQHVTLAFLADVSAARLDRLVERLEAALTVAPVALRLAGAGAFPNPYAARVLFVDVEDLGGRLGPLARRVRGAANHAGVSVDGARFHPHVTVARSRRPVAATRWIRMLDTYAGPGWVAEEVELIESHLGQGRGGRPRYVTVERFALSAGG